MSTGQITLPEQQGALTPKDRFATDEEADRVAASVIARRQELLRRLAE